MMRAVLALVLLVAAGPVWAADADDPLIKRFTDDWTALDGALNAAEVLKARVAEDMHQILLRQIAVPAAGHKDLQGVK
jgi:hypothetical protein